MTWKNKTCEKCVFNIEDQCRRFPPDTEHGFPVVAEYAWNLSEMTDTVIKLDKPAEVTSYSPACAEYTQSLSQPDHSCSKCGHGMITSPEHPSRYCTKCGEGF